MITTEEFEKKKQALKDELLKAQKEEGTIALGKSTSNLFRHRKQGKTNKINVRHFNNVISIDTKNKTADVEGMTPYETVVAECLKHNLMPTVVPELKSITVGGALTGVGIESSSFKYGLVHETVLESEIILGDGRILTCTPTNEHKDLFFGFPNSYGTLGYALRVRIKLIPVKKYVRLTHLQYTEAEKYFEDIKRHCLDTKVDFVDGTIFSTSEMYITLGEFVDSVPNKVSDYTHMNIYYKSIQEKKTDFLTILDYIWRWDTDWFWCSKHFGVQRKFIRRLFGKKRLNSKVYQKIRQWNHKHPILSKFSKRKESIVQDIEVPVDVAHKFVDFFFDTIKIKPVWVCPTKFYNKEVNFPLYPMDKDTLYINFGFWDVVPTTKEDGYYNRLIEKKVRELSGKKSLYSTSFYSQDEFWELYNKRTYDILKKKYDPNGAFLGLYDKCVGRK